MFDNDHDRLWERVTLISTAYLPAVSNGHNRPRYLRYFQIYEEAGLHDDDYDIRKIIREIIPGQICSVTASDEEIRGLIAALEERWDDVST